MYEAAQLPWLRSQHENNFIKLATNNFSRSWKKKTFFIKQYNFFPTSRKAIHLNQQHPVVLISPRRRKIFLVLTCGKNELFLDWSPKTEQSNLCLFTKCLILNSRFTAGEMRFSCDLCCKVIAGDHAKRLPSWRLRRKFSLYRNLDEPSARSFQFEMF